MPVFNNALAGAAGQAGGAGAGYKIERSLRFNGINADLTRNFSSGGNNRTFTVSTWVKLSETGNVPIITAGTANSFYATIRIQSGSVEWIYWSGGTQQRVATTAKLKDYGSWYHVVVAFDTTQTTQEDRIKFYVNGEQLTEFSQTTWPPSNALINVNSGGAHRIGSLRPYVATIWGDASFAEMHLVDGQQLAATDFGEYDNKKVWNPKEYEGTYGTTGFYLDFSDPDALGTDRSGTNNNWVTSNVVPTSPVDRIPSSPSYKYGTTAWNGATATTATPPALAPNNAFMVDLGSVQLVNKITFDVVSTHTSDTTSTFRVLAGTASAWDLTSCPGTNCGFVSTNISSPALPGTSKVTIYLHQQFTRQYFAIQNTGSGQHTYTNLKVMYDNGPADSTLDTPTSYQDSSGDRGNYPTWNINQLPSGTSLTRGAMEFHSSNASAWYSMAATVAVSSGKWYWESQLKGTDTSHFHIPGIVGADWDSWEVPNFHTHTPSYGYYSSNGKKMINGVQSTYGEAFGLYTVIGVALDLDNNTLEFYKNGQSQGSFAIDPGIYRPAVSMRKNSTAVDFYVAVNFGQTPFEGTVPAGFKTLCSANLPTPTIEDPATAFDAVAYTGNGNTLSVPTTTDKLKFSPDLVWTKGRSAGYGHLLHDSLRGDNIYLSTSSTGGQTDLSPNGISLDADGWTESAVGGLNVNNGTFVGWAWDAGTTTDTNNTDGSITPTGVRANPSSGFSMITYNGSGSNATMGHGLNAKPRFVIHKRLDSTSGNWRIFMDLFDGSMDTMFLNTTTYRTDSTLTAPTTSVINLGTDSDHNALNIPYIAYCFAPVEGFSNFGNYRGAGTHLNPFVFTGFAPKFVIIKCNSHAGNWLMYDAARSPNNRRDEVLYGHINNQESSNLTTHAINFLSNGFKVESTDSGLNTNGRNYTYLAFAEHPFKTARAR